MDEARHSFYCCSECRPCVSLGEERATVTTHTHTHKYAPTHTFICWSKYGTFVGGSPSRPFNSIFSADTHTMKLIDYSAKNQLGAGYVRTMGELLGTVLGGEGGREGGSMEEEQGRRGGEEEERSHRDSLHVKLKCGECERHTDLIMTRQHVSLWLEPQQSVPPPPHVFVGCRQDYTKSTEQDFYECVSIE